MNSSKTDGVKEKKESRREPLVRIARRDALPQYKAWGIRGAAILISLIVCGFIIFAITKMNPVKVYATMFEGAFGTESRTWITIKDAMLLLCVSVALAPAFKMSYWNIGAEGQVLVGGIATAACMIYFKNLPAPLLFIVMII
ncbi:MAG: ABC transporter permease, partial [Eubacteriales bacterium]